DKTIILAHKPLINVDEVHYYAYDFSYKRLSYNQDFDSRRYYQQHDADYHE
ncbi:cystatin-like fold lipoprotein, partial [Staphylococcus aureus]|nr:cystatin-like fold lipoprotein [Staphylococcus aureus]